MTDGVEVASENVQEEFQEKKGKEKVWKKNCNKVNFSQRPALFLSPTLQDKRPLYAIELHKLLGLCFLPQHFTQWPK